LNDGTVDAAAPNVNVLVGAGAAAEDAAAANMDGNVAGAVVAGVLPNRDG